METKTGAIKIMSIQEHKKKIAEDLQSNPVVLYMKGSKLMPQCGFSAKVVQILQRLEIPFETRDVLQNDHLRQAIKEFSDWPTLPQLYVQGEFIGGCDIISELYESGELQKMFADLLSTDSSDM